MSRKYSYDLLRVFASMSVVMLHISAIGFSNYSINSFEWNICNVFDSISRWGVPVFLMISGSLFLSKDIPIKILFAKYIFRIFIIFYSWSFVYSVRNYIIYGDIINTVENFFLIGNYHEWYLLLIIGLYILTPILRKVIEDKKIEEYSIIVIFVFSFFLPSLGMIIENLGHYTGYLLSEYSKKFYIPCGYIAYYILGHYISNYGIKRKKVLYLLGLINIFITIFGTSILSNINNELTSLYSNTSINVFFISIAIFTYFTNLDINPRKPKFLFKLSKCTIGIYAVHPLFISLFSNLGLTVAVCNPLISIPLIFTIVYITSFISSFLLNLIPFIREYVV